MYFSAFLLERYWGRNSAVQKPLPAVGGQRQQNWGWQMCFRAWFPLKSIRIGCLWVWLLASLHNNVIGRNHRWDGINQRDLGSSSILMLVLPIVWTVPGSPRTTISDEFADSLFFVTVKLSFQLTVAHSKDSLVSVCCLSLFWFLH